jgi:hypothetical protein
VEVAVLGLGLLLSAAAAVAVAPSSRSNRLQQTQERAPLIRPPMCMSESFADFFYLAAVTAGLARRWALAQRGRRPHQRPLPRQMQVHTAAAVAALRPRTTPQNPLLRYFRVPEVVHDVFERAF